MSFNRSRLADRTEEDEEAALDLDVNGSTFSNDHMDAILESAQKSMEESRVKIEKVAPDKKSIGRIDYQLFKLPDDREKYISHVNEDNRKVMKEEIREGKNGALLLHLFSVVTTLN